jgi:hypothetical protein
MVQVGAPMSVVGSWATSGRPPVRLLDGPGPVGSARRASRVGAPDRGVWRNAASVPVAGRRLRVPWHVSTGVAA